MGELTVCLAGGLLHTFVDEVVGGETGNPSNGQRTSWFCHDGSLVVGDRFVVILTQIDIDRRRRHAVHVAGRVELATYSGPEWHSARWVGEMALGGTSGEVVWGHRLTAPFADLLPGPRGRGLDMSVSRDRRLVPRR